MRELGLLGFGEELALLLSPPPLIMLLFIIVPFLRRRLRPALLLLSMLVMPAVHEYGVTLSNTCNTRFLRATVWEMRHLYTCKAKR